MDIKPQRMDLTLLFQIHSLIIDCRLVMSVNYNSRPYCLISKSYFPEIVASFKILPNTPFY